MTANPNHPREVKIPAHATFRAEEGAGFRVYIVSIPGKGDTCIEVAWSAVAAFEECVVGRVLGQPVPRIAFYGEVPRGTLSQPQLDGFACVECGAGQGPGMAFIPAGFVRGSGQVFRCADECPAAFDPTDPAGGE